ncbi:MAG TPA: hypothetical protein V6C90_10180 [Coleofasciculaceae cyanobacterium]|jgi:hypothetical protein
MPYPDDTLSRDNNRSLRKGKKKLIAGNMIILAVICATSFLIVVGTALMTNYHGYIEWNLGLHGTHFIIDGRR